MDVLPAFELISACLGIALSLLLCLFPRFGALSWIIASSILLGSVATAALSVIPSSIWRADDMALFAFAAMLLYGTNAWLASYMVERTDFVQQLKQNRWFFTFMLLLAPALIVAVYTLRPSFAPPTDAPSLVSMGVVGYGAAAYQLFVSLIGLANIEQTVRNAEEHLRWEIKFLLLGMASGFAGLIYLSSHVLLYAPDQSFLTLKTLRVFAFVFCCSCLLILQSWRKSTGRGGVAVSQGVVYSTITFFSVGIYLAASSLAARRLSARVALGLPSEAIIFIVAAILLSAILLATGFRHRARKWIRRNVYAGQYDYRKLWMDAAEKVQSVDPPAAMASALARLVHEALGSIDVTIWLKAPDTQIMRLVAALGTVSETFNQESLSAACIPASLTRPVAVREINEHSHGTLPADFLKRAKASLVVPLISSGRLIGLITVGPDRSDRDFDREAREFLRVLAVHGASEFHKSELLDSLVQKREAEAFQTFATFLLHDLKNFASTLSLIANNAVRHHNKPDFQLDAFRSILDTADKMKRLCNGLRGFSSTLAANKRQDDLNDIVRELVRDFEPCLLQRLTLQLSRVPNIQVDRQEFSRVLQNLILNASEAAASGPVEVSTRTEFGRIVVCVSDKGKGIPKDFLQHRLFQPFHTTKADGLGIGLFQSKKIVEAHGGTIEVESTEGEGTIVRIVMPVSKLEQASLQTVAARMSSVELTEEPLRHAAEELTR